VISFLPSFQFEKAEKEALVVNFCGCWHSLRTFPRRLFLSVIVDRRDNEITSFKLEDKF